MQDEAMMSLIVTSSLFLRLGGGEAEMFSAEGRGAFVKKGQQFCDKECAPR